MEVGLGKRCNKQWDLFSTFAINFHKNIDKKAKLPALDVTMYLIFFFFNIKLSDNLVL